MSKDIELALNKKILPFTDIELRTADWWCFRTGNTLAFCPTELDPKHLDKCFRAAYKLGYEQFEAGKVTGFDIHLEVSRDQKILYPVVYMVPKNDN